jgi:hypothetical protein
VKRRITALAVALLAFPATAIAATDEPSNSGSPLTSRVPDVASDMRAPDQRTPRDVPPRLPAIGTDVAATDQQSSLGAPSPAASPSADGFDWTDAGIGAAGAATLLAISLAGAITLRRPRSGAGGIRTAERG